MEVLHRIKAYLYENLLTKDNPNDFIARTASERSLNVQQICDAAVSRGGADVSAAAMEHAVALFLKEMAYQLCDGFSVNTGYFTASTQIRGVFDSPVETFNPDKHNILFQFNQGERLRAEIQNIEVEILGLADSASAILQVTDIKSGSIDDLLTPGRNLRIIGNRIRLAGDNPANGIFFVDADTGARKAVEPVDIVMNNPSMLMVVIPDLVPGKYKLELVTQFTAGTPLKEPRTIVFEKGLTVQKS